jgi:hypothetical protein
MPGSPNRRSCLVVLLIAAVMIGVAIWYLTDFSRVPSAGTMPQAPDNSLQPVDPRSPS